MFLFGRVYPQFTLKDKLVSCHVQGGYLVTMTELARGSKRTEHETSVGEVEGVFLASSPLTARGLT